MEPHVTRTCSRAHQINFTKLFFFKTSNYPYPPNQIWDKNKGTNKGIQANIDVQLDCVCVCLFSDRNIWIFCRYVFSISFELQTLISYWGDQQSFWCFCLSFLGKLRGALMFAPKDLQLSPFCADLNWKLTLYCELQCKNDAKIKQNKKIRKNNVLIHTITL